MCDGLLGVRRGGPVMRFNHRKNLAVDSLQI
jgi:hypothetical protein